jgi:hypothetical protein
MKQGKSINQLYRELERQRKARKDIVADTRTMKVTTDNGQSMLTVGTGRGKEEYLVSEVAHRQLAERLQIPFKYYERMQQDYPVLLDQNINGWLLKNYERRMLRTMDGSVRAFLSDRYRRLDNLELADSVLPVIAEMEGADVISAEVTETRMFIKVINKTLKAEVTTGDVVQAGFVISNSEVGLGAVRVEPLIYRLVCRNGLVVKDYATKKYHAGRQVSGLDEAYELYSDETMQADDKAFFMKVQDIVKTAVDEARFNLCVGKLKASRKEFTGDDPVQTVEVLGDKYLLNKNERAAIMRHFIMGSDVSSYGLINAVTRASQDVEDYNRATDLERIGGELLAGTKLATVEALPYIETTAVEVPVRSKVLRISDSKRR